MPTPNHPEYPAAHGAVSTAYAEALRYFFGTKKVTITLTSTITGTAHTFYNTDDIIKEIIVARIYGGMHYRTSGVHGSVIGKKVANWVAKNYFLPAGQQAMGEDKPAIKEGKGQSSFFCVSSTLSRSFRVDLNRILTLVPSSSAASPRRDFYDFITTG